MQQLTQKANGGGILRHIGGFHKDVGNIQLVQHGDGAVIDGIAVILPHDQHLGVALDQRFRIGVWPHAHAADHRQPVQLLGKKLRCVVLALEHQSRHQVGSQRIHHVSPVRGGSVEPRNVIGKRDLAAAHIDDLTAIGR